MIRGYKADIDPAAVGLGFEAIVFVTLRQVDRPTMEIFENRVADNPNIVEAQRLFGSPDYLLKVIAEDLPVLPALLRQRTDGPARASNG